MKIKNCTREQLQAALAEVNKKFAGNVKFNRFEMTNQTAAKVTLTVIDSRAPGGRIGLSGKQVCAACWHVYGTFIDEVIKADGKVFTNNQWIESHDQNWQDWNIGSQYRPLYYSEACDCE